MEASLADKVDFHLIIFIFFAMLLLSMLFRGDLCPWGSRFRLHQWQGLHSWANLGDGGYHVECIGLQLDCATLTQLPSALLAIGRCRARLRDLVPRHVLCRVDIAKLHLLAIRTKPNRWCCFVFGPNHYDSFYQHLVAILPTTNGLHAKSIVRMYRWVVQGDRDSTSRHQQVQGCQEEVLQSKVSWGCQVCLQGTNVNIAIYLRHSPSEVDLITEQAFESRRWM